MSPKHPCRPCITCSVAQCDNRHKFSHATTTLQLFLKYFPAPVGGTEDSFGSKREQTALALEVCPVLNKYQPQRCAYSRCNGIDLVRDRLGRESTSLPPGRGQEESQASCGWYVPCPAVCIRTWYPLPQAAREHPELLHHHEAAIISTIAPSMSIGAGPPRPPIRRRQHSKDWERLETRRSLLSRNTTFHQSNYSKEHPGSLNDATTGRHESSARDSHHEDYRPT